MTDLLRSLRPCYFGFGFFWTVPLLMSLGIPQIVSPSREWLLFSGAQQIFTLVFLCLCVLVLHKRENKIPSDAAFLAGLALSSAAFLYVMAFTFGFYATWISILLGALCGLGCSLFYLLWQRAYAAEKSNCVAVYLPLSCLFAVIMCLVMRFLPVLLAAFIIIVFLPFGATYLLRASLSRVRPASPLKESQAPLRLKSLWQPVLCASIVCFAWALSSHIPALYDRAMVTASLIGFGTASLLIALVVLITRKSLLVLDAYQAVFPILGIVLLLPLFFGDTRMNILTGSLSFGQHIFKLLTLIMAASYASNTQHSPITVFGLCVIPLQAAIVLGDLLGFSLVGILSSGERVLQMSLICLVALFVGVGLSSLKKRFSVGAAAVDEPVAIGSGLAEGADGAAPHGEGEVESGMTNPAASSASASAKGSANDELDELERLAQTEPGKGMSTRELEVIALLLKGNSVEAVSRKLFISENTTRGHTKRIYRKLGVHSRQELVDLFEG